MSATIRTGKWAFITGAARESGLGYSFARHLAIEGMNLVLVDILEDELAKRATELRENYGVEVRPVVLNLGERDFMHGLAPQTDDIEIDLLVCNHMYTPQDTPTILDMDLEMHHRMIDINARAYMTLIHSYGRKMRARQQGGIVVVASGAGLVPTPYTGAYAANKAYQIAFGEALWYELKGTGVDVVVLAAGLMNTQGDALSQYPQFMMQEPEDVVEEVLANLGKKHLVIPGWINKLFMFMQMKLMSRQQAINSIGNFMAGGLGKDK